MKTYKYKTEAQKTSSSLSKDINRLKKLIIQLDNANRHKKELLFKFDVVIKKLLEEKRLTKTELSSFFKRS